jgi:hypothetical protein
MSIRESLLAALTERFGERGLRMSAAPGPIATFPPTHPQVGELVVTDSGGPANFSANVRIGDVISSHFVNYDSHLEAHERADRLTNEIVWFLQELFADRILFWRSADGRNAGWRQHGEHGSEPLVLDNRAYRTYLWSGPVTVWQAIPAILARLRIQDDREYEIISEFLRDPGSDGPDGAQRDLASRLAADYDRERPV